MVSIKQVRNGYIVSLPSNEKVFTSLDEVLAELLNHFEGRSPGLGGDAYGVVSIQRERDTAPRHDGISGLQMSVAQRPPLDILS